MKNLIKFNESINQEIQKILRDLYRSGSEQSAKDIMQLLGLDSGLIHISGSIEGSLAVESRQIKVYSNGKIHWFDCSDGIFKMNDTWRGGLEDGEMPHGLNRGLEGIVVIFENPDWYKPNKYFSI